MKLSVIVPLYNEENNLKELLRRFNKISKQQKLELICINDGSTDNTIGKFRELKLANKYGFARLISHPTNRGYGAAIMKGVMSARGEIISWTHSDLQTDPEDIIKAYSLFIESKQKKLIIKGFRVGRPVSQAIFSAGMALFASVILRTPFTEINAQPKMFSREFIKYLKYAPTDFSLDLFLLYQAKRNGYSVKSFPVKFIPRIHGQSTWSSSFSKRINTITRSIRYICKLEASIAANQSK